MTFTDAAPETVTIVELVWTVLAALGVLVQALLLTDTLKTWHAAEDDPHGNERRGRLIRGHLRAAGAFLFVHASFLVAGVRALTTPNLPVSAGRLLTVALFMSASIVLVWIGLADRRDRAYIRRMPRRRRTDGELHD